MTSQFSIVAYLGEGVSMTAPRARVCDGDLHINGSESYGGNVLSNLPLGQLAKVFAPIDSFTDLS